MSTQGGSSVRIGPISLFALIAIISLATLAVLSVTTANASYKMANLQAETMSEQYAAESAAQHFVALIDQEASETTGSAQTRAAAVASSINAIVQVTQQEADSRITVNAIIKGTDIEAQFACSNGRVLKVALTILTDGNYQVKQWNMTAMENNAQSENLWSGM